MSVRESSEPLDPFAGIRHRDAAYGPDLAAPQARRLDLQGQCVWDRRRLLAEVGFLTESLAAERARVQRVEALHSERGSNCGWCGDRWPCRTVAALHGATSPEGPAGDTEGSDQ